MIETFAGLFFAHILADFVFQTTWMVENKKKPGVFLLHGFFVLVTAYAALGRIDVWHPLALTAVHLGIDALKTYALPQRLWAYLADQAAHLLTILIISIYAPPLLAGGVWADISNLPAAMILISGFIAATTAGGYAVAMLIENLELKDTTDGLSNGGKIIGLLERGLIFLLILVGQPAGIGFLVAAKSVLRFESSKSQKVSEYVIIGTLASFGWAMAIGWTTVGLLSALPPLGFPTVSP